LPQAPRITDQLIIYETSGATDFTLQRNCGFPDP